MRKILVLLALAVSVLCAGETNVASRDLGDFTIKAYTDTSDNHWEMNIYKKGSDKVYQQIYNVPTGYRCLTNLFLGKYTDAEGNQYDFTFICTVYYNTWVFKYEPESKEFVKSHLGADLHELKVLKNAYLGATYLYEDNTVVSIYVFDKLSGDMTQRIDIDCSEDNWSDVCDFNKNEQHLEIGDYNFDGFDDFRLADSYYLYEPKNNTFPLSEIYGDNLVFDPKTKTITDTYWDRWDSHESITVYKVVNNKMVAISQKCTAYIGFEGEIELNIEKCDNFSATKYNLRSRGLKNNFELQLTILDYEGKKAVVVYKGQKAYINLALKSKSDIERVYNEMADGKVTGTYIIYDGIDGVKGAYIRGRDGKRFELENAWD